MSAEERPAAPGTGLIAGRKHALDGLRTIAVAGVFFFHTATDILPGGSIGVDVFFTLSGFVITLLIMKERLATGRLHLGIFYAKRLARLWPALLALCAVIVVVGFVFPASGWGGQAGFVLPAAAYVMNLAHFGTFGDSIAGETLGPTWTLAVEEQFYLVWPLLLLVMLRFWKVRTVACATLALAGAFLLNRFLLVSAGQPLARIYNGPDTRADELLIGCALALLFTSLRPGSRPHRALVSVARWGAPLAAITLAAALFLLKEPDTPGAWFTAFWTAGPAVLALLVRPADRRPCAPAGRLPGADPEPSVARQARPRPFICDVPLAFAGLSAPDAPDPGAAPPHCPDRGPHRAGGVRVVPLC